VGASARKGGGHALHDDTTYNLVTCDDIDRLGLEAGIDERSRSSAPVQQFKGYAPQNKGLGLVGPRCRLVTIRTATP
jgi:hypothetical protein